MHLMIFAVIVFPSVVLFNANIAKYHKKISVNTLSLGITAFLYLLSTDYYWFVLMGHQNGLLSQTSCGLFMAHLYCPLV